MIGFIFLIASYSIKLSLYFLLIYNMMNMERKERKTLLAEFNKVKSKQEVIMFKKATQRWLKRGS